MNAKKEACAPTNVIGCWEDIDFNLASNHVKKLQIRIARAWQEGAFGKVECFQHKMIHSFYAKALAVHTVTTNRGKLTSGVDDILWVISEDKWNAISALKRRGYNPKPLKRIYIPKSNGKMRPLSIPTIMDRAMQTLYKFALEPIAETTADPNSYGFRFGRSTRDAITRCAYVLSEYSDQQWILKADIKAFFDNISHPWIMEHIPMDKEILHKFLSCGYIEERSFVPTESGIPQGGCISTVICNMVLDGLEKELDVKLRIMLNDKNSHYPIINFVRYADDIIITGKSEEILNLSVIPILKNFLSERGLELSLDNTVVSHIEDGFDFLGWNVCKIDNQLCITPSRKSLNAILNKIHNTIESNFDKTYGQLLVILHPIIQGWINYHINVVTKSSLNNAAKEMLSCIGDLTDDNLIYYLWNHTPLFFTIKVRPGRAHGD